MQELFSCQVISSSLRPHELQHARLPWPSHVPESAQTHVHWISDAIQPSPPLVAPFSSCPQFFPASGSFPVSWLFASGGQSIGASASASGLTMNILGWFPLGLTGLISQSKGFSRVFSKTVQKHQFFGTRELDHSFGKTIALTIRTYVGKVMSLLFNNFNFKIINVLY